MEDYRRLADAVAARIAAGRLRPGDRLPTQRAFAHRHRVAPSTAGRVYAELVRRGLVMGEVGRGTFVRAVEPPSGRPLTQPGTGGAAVPVNLELNYPVVPGQAEALSASLAPLLRPDVLAEATGTVSPRGTAAARRAAAGLFGPDADPDRVLFAGNGRQAIAAALVRAAPRGARLGVEPLTYPLVKEIAERLGRLLVPLPTDAYGIVPEAVRAERPAALYVQPVLHNPTSRTTPSARRAELAAVAAELGIPVIEDRVWSFLREDEAPAPGGDRTRTYVVDSLSKRLAPGLTVGLLYVPKGEAGRTETALRTGGWSAPRFALEAARRWLEDGTVARLSEAKRRDAAARQALVARHLAGDFVIDTDPHGYYAWWELPSPWRADTFVAAARERGVAVTPGSAFAVPPYTAPRRVRLGLASPEPSVLAGALERLAALARSTESSALSP
ncbi:PLP-dependent aminotransferase family protein [Streptomyces sp. NPDC007088]|uniref:aminotransferase-like domain-containing protein n=1 Tax=Streptomyces sp. NPDC007088 TaxID=3364773 RepID=UPI00368FF768